MSEKHVYFFGAGKADGKAEMKFVNPVDRVGNEEGANFITTIIKNERPPILMFALAGVGVGVKVGAVEKVEAGAVFGEMSRNPIQDHADVVLMALVDKVH